MGRTLRQTDSILDSLCSNARPIFLFTPPIQQTCAPFWYILFATLYQKTPQFLCYATYFRPKTPFYVVKHIKLFGSIKKKTYLCNRFQQIVAKRCHETLRNTPFSRCRLSAPPSRALTFPNLYTTIVIFLTHITKTH